MPRFHVVTIVKGPRPLLEKTVRRDTASARTVICTRILLQADTGKFGSG